MPDEARKPSAGTRRFRKEPPHADYHDDVTDKQLERIRALVKDEELSDAEEESGPAW